MESAENAAGRAAATSAKKAASAIATRAGRAAATAKAANALSAGQAADAAALAIQAVSRVQELAFTTSLAAQAANRAGVPARLLRRDFTALHSAVIKFGWNDASPIPSSAFDYIDLIDAESVSPSDSQLSLKVYLGPTADPEKVEDKLVELYAALNDYSLERYGRGLTIKEFEQYVVAGVPLPTGGG